MGTGFEVCESWYDYKEENDVMYNFISVFDSIARVMETEGMVWRNFTLYNLNSNAKPIGTIFIFEWYYIMWTSVHPTEAQKRNNRSKMRKISHEGRKTRNEKMLKELGHV